MQGDYRLETEIHARNSIVILVTEGKLILNAVVRGKICEIVCNSFEVGPGGDIIQTHDATIRSHETIEKLEAAELNPFSYDLHRLLESMFKQPEIYKKYREMADAKWEIGEILEEELEDVALSFIKDQFDAVSAFNSVLPRTLDPELRRTYATAFYWEYFKDEKSVELFEIMYGEIFLAVIAKLKNMVQEKKKLGEKGLFKYFDRKESKDRKEILDLAGEENYDPAMIPGLWAAMDQVLDAGSKRSIMLYQSFLVFNNSKIKIINNRIISGNLIDLNDTFENSSLMRGLFIRGPAAMGFVVFRNVGPGAEVLPPADSSPASKMGESDFASYIPFSLEKLAVKWRLIIRVDNPIHDSGLVFLIAREDLTINAPITIDGTLVIIAEKQLFLNADVVADNLFIANKRIATIEENFVGSCKMTGPGCIGAVTFDELMKRFLNFLNEEYKKHFNQGTTTQQELGSVREKLLLNRCHQWIGKSLQIWKAGEKILAEARSSTALTAEGTAVSEGFSPPSLTRQYDSQSHPTLRELAGIPAASAVPAIAPRPAVERTEQRFL